MDTQYEYHRDQNVHSKPKFDPAGGCLYTKRR